MATCPNCGSDNAKFKRERARTVTSSLSTRSRGIGFGSRQTTSEAEYHIVGFCPDCGYSWEKKDPIVVSASSDSDETKKVSPYWIAFVPALIVALFCLYITMTSGTDTGFVVNFFVSVIVFVIVFIPLAAIIFVVQLIRSAVRHK